MVGIRIMPLKGASCKRFSGIAAYVAALISQALPFPGAAFLALQCMSGESLPVFWLVACHVCMLRAVLVAGSMSLQLASPARASRHLCLHVHCILSSD